MNIYKSKNRITTSNYNYIYNKIDCFDILLKKDYSNNHYAFLTIIKNIDPRSEI
jgi:hypothetical protein